MRRKLPSNIEGSTHSAHAMNRRRFLRGLGACVALPAFESLLPRRAHAAKGLGKAASEPPRTHNRPADIVALLCG